MEPKIDLDNLEDNITITNPGAVSGVGPYTVDTITLSGLGATYSNTMVTGGGYTVAPNISISSGTGITSPWASTSAYPWLGNGISTGKDEGGKLILEGENADVEINGVSIAASIKRIEERLNILVTNPSLEEEWEELKELGEKYRELEKHIKEKQATWDRLKAMPPPLERE